MNPDEAGQYRDRVLDGDVDAFRFIVRQFQHMAHSIAISIVKEQADADDVVQNAFIRCYKSLGSFKGDSKFSSWLYKIVVNESLKHLRKNKRSFLELSESQMENTDDFIQTSRNLELTEMKAAIKLVLNKMKPKEALILKLHYLHEQAISEIEEITGFSKSNIKVLLFRARASFMSIYLMNK